MLSPLPGMNSCLEQRQVWEEFHLAFCARRCDYCVLVIRAEERPEMGVWPLRLRDRLPETPIPLREPHPDARIDLQAVLHHVYDAAGYADYLYVAQPESRLHPEDDARAEQVLATAQA